MEAKADAAAVELPSGLDSGDIVLFNRRCMSMSIAGAALCVVAKLFDNSQWDHVGVVVRHPDTGELLFLEADFGGVKLRSLGERVRRSKSNEIAVRRLSVVRTDAMRERLYAFSQEMLGRPYEIGTGSMIARVTDPVAKQDRERLHALLIDKRAQVAEIDRELETAALTTFQRRLLQSERERVFSISQQIQSRLMKELEANSNAAGKKNLSTDGQATDLSRVFCSELVAAAYQRLGLLESYPPAFSYNPKDFSSEQTNPPGVHLLRAARLSNENFLRELPSRIEANKKNGNRRKRQTSSGARSLRGVKENDLPSRESRILIRDVLKRTPIYGMIPDEYKRSHFTKSFRARILEPGDVVFEQGDYGDRLYVIESGAVERFMSKGDEDPILCSNLSARNTFGLTAFTFNCPRVATIRAKERTLLWQVDRPTFELFKDTSSDIRSIKSNADLRTLRSLVKDHFLFQRLDKLGPNELDQFFLVKFRAGEHVFKQGDAGDNFYIIKSGELERHIRHPRPNRNGADQQRGDLSPDDETSSLAKTLNPGQSFGELSLMYNAPRAATIRARTDCECWAISAESFHQLNLGGGTQYLRAIFKKYASVERGGKAYMTPDDLLRFADIDAFPEEDRERLSSLLVSLVTSNRERDPVRVERKRIRAEEKAGNADDDGDVTVAASANGNNGDDDAEEADDMDEEVLMDFWEFVRFDIVLNQPAAEMDFAFRLADQNNSGFISLEEMQYLLQAYAHVDETAEKMVTGELGTLKKVFGKAGSNTISATEFQRLSHDILPPLFRSDVNKLTHHMLNMDVASGRVGEHLSMLDDMDVSFIEPDGSPSVLGSQFVKSSAPKTSTFSSKKPSNVTGAAISQKPLWLQSIEWDHLLSVGISGAASRTAVAPLERLKILMQTQPVGAKGPYTGLFSGLRAMVREDSSLLRAMFRGNGANVLRIVPNAAIQLAMVERLHGYLAAAAEAGVGPAGNAARSRAVDAVAIGGLAGMVAASATYPLDFIRGRLTIQRTGFEPYRGVTHGLRKCIGEEGLHSIFRGITPTLLGVIPYVGLSFTLFETVRPILPRKNDGSGRPTTGSAIVCGAMASATGQMAAYPLDLCRRRMQVGGFGNAGLGGRGMRDVLRDVVKTEGVRGLYRGLVPNLIKVAPASCVSFLAYEQVRTSYNLVEGISARAAAGK